MKMWIRNVGINHSNHLSVKFHNLLLSNWSDEFRKKDDGLTREAEALTQQATKVKANIYITVQMARVDTEVVDWSSCPE